MAVRLLPWPKSSPGPISFSRVNHDANGQAWQTAASNTRLITLSCQWPPGRVVSLTKPQQVASQLSPFMLPHQDSCLLALRLTECSNQAFLQRRSPFLCFARRRKHVASRNFSPSIHSWFEIFPTIFVRKCSQWYCPYLQNVKNAVKYEMQNDNSLTRLFTGSLCKISIPFLIHISTSSWR